MHATIGNPEEAQKELDLLEFPSRIRSLEIRIHPGPKHTLTVCQEEQH